MKFAPHTILIALALGILALSLGIGIFHYSRKSAQALQSRWMKGRVWLQGLAIILLMWAYWLKSKGVS